MAIEQTHEQGTETESEVYIAEQHDEDISSMEQALENAKPLPEPGDTVEGTVIGIDETAVYIDLPPHGTGIIYGREYMNARAMIRKTNVGDTISGKVVDHNHPDGYIEISLREARQAIIWSEAEEHVKNKNILEVSVTDANKGGLILNWQGLQGFLPASQLKTEHYPRVEDGDKDKILMELRKLVGQPLNVTMITAVPQENKLIFSEKDPARENKEKIIDKYSGLPQNVW